MKVRFTVEATADLKEKDRGAVNLLRASAHDEGSGLSYWNEWEPGTHNPLERAMMKAFDAAYRQFGFKTEVIWGEEKVPNHYNEAIHAKDGATCAVCDRWLIGHAPRKRRWGTISLTAFLDWEEEFPFPPSEYTNPLGNEMKWAADERFIDQGNFSCFAPSSMDYTRERIEGGLRAARETLAFYERMAALYEERTGEPVSGGAAC